MKSILFACALELSTAQFAVAKEPLSSVDYINDRLFAASVGDQIRRNCDRISARMLRVLADANRLKNHAISLGYTEDEISAYVKNTTEISKMKRRRDAYLVDHGALGQGSEAYCALGRAEIARGSLIGSLLKAR
jgi:hypothetical protein